MTIPRYLASPNDPTSPLCCSDEHGFDPRFPWVILDTEDRNVEDYCEDRDEAETRADELNNPDPRPWAEVSHNVVGFDGFSCAIDPGPDEDSLILRPNRSAAAQDAVALRRLRRYLHEAEHPPIGTVATRDTSDERSEQQERPALRFRQGR